jgi:hypothetical protein
VVKKIIIFSFHFPSGYEFPLQHSFERSIACPQKDIHSTFVRAINFHNTSCMKIIFEHYNKGTFIEKLAQPMYHRMMLRSYRFTHGKIHSNMSMCLSHSLSFLHISMNLIFHFYLTHSLRKLYEMRIVGIKSPAARHTYEVE